MSFGQTANIKTIRRILLENRDGLTLHEIAKLIGKGSHGVRESLKRMPDAYIDRWIDTSIGPDGSRRGGTPWSPVYCVIVVPANCPMPSPKSKYL